MDGRDIKVATSTGSVANRKLDIPLVKKSSCMVVALHCVALSDVRTYVRFFACLV
jgi:hypothetical protein